MRAVYSLLTLFALPLVLFRLFWRSRRQAAYREHIRERFARYDHAIEAPVLWLHAVSVGEMRAAQSLVTSLREILPDHRWLLTCMTPTGRETAESLYGTFATITYLPYDLPGLGARFLRHFRPAAGLLMETEVWPNMLSASRQAGVPMFLVNARLSERSARGYRRFGALSRSAFAHLDLAIAQTNADAERLIDCGVRSVAVAGNVKFDIAPDPLLLDLGRAWRSRHFPERPVLLAASTRDGEESLILDAFQRMRAPNLLLILVPRHPQRFDAVSSLIEKRGLILTRRSYSMPNAETQVWLGDSMGELVAYYAAADIAIMGGSFGPYGSQNLIEGCAAGCPVLVGPSDFNFSQAVTDALAASAAIRVTDDATTLAGEAERLLADPVELNQLKGKAVMFAQAHRGATLRTIAAILDALKTNTKPSDITRSTSC